MRLKILMSANGPLAFDEVEEVESVLAISPSVHSRRPYQQMKITPQNTLPLVHGT